jgi:sulfate adenylyltransferase
MKQQNENPEGVSEHRIAHEFQDHRSERSSQKGEPDMTLSSPTPHGGTLVNRLFDHDPNEFAHLPKLELSDRNLADFELIATGVYSPLTGFMGRQDHDSVVSEMRLANSTPWSIPITLGVPANAATRYKDTVALTRHGEIIGTLEVTEQFTPDRSREALEVYRTTDDKHPGVAALYAQGEVNLAGPIRLFRLPRGEFPRHHHTPLEARAAFQERGWRSVVAFQTRNPIHRAHEYLHKVTLETVDGLFLNPLVGSTKSDDMPASARMRAYEVLIERYYPASRVLLGVYPAAMRYAGPREAILHAISRKNYGCTHFIVGRDHAGVGTYYGTYDAQEVFGAFSKEEIGIEIIKFEHTFYCKTCGSVVSSRTCPHDSHHHLALSGTKVRELLMRGEHLPETFTRPEVAEVLRQAYWAQTA